MSLLLNEEFTLYRLRLGYLNSIHDGVGERLIHLNTSILSDPAFRQAGWELPEPATVKRCYSPPIPTTGAADYFARPRTRNEGRGYGLVDSPAEERPGEGRGGLISGHGGNEDVVPLSGLTEKGRRRRKTHGQKEQEDDSSDLSDDSDEEEGPAQSVRFAKMPTRNRSRTSPVRETLRAEAVGPEVNIITPSYRPRTSSLGATEAINQANAQANAQAAQVRTGRPRRDTTTSSEMSSDTEGLAPEKTFKKRLPTRPQRPALLSEKIAEEEPDDSELEDEYEEEDVEVAEASDLSDEFEHDGAPPSPGLPIVGEAEASEEVKKSLPSIPTAVTPTHKGSPKKSSKENLVKLPRLPPGRPMSIAPPTTGLLSMALKSPSGEASGGDDKPYRKFAELYGKGEAQPIWIKIYAPFSDSAEDPLQVPMRRQKDGDGGVPTVNELIGLALFRYDDEDYEPPLTGKDVKVENWELRMVEDGEVDMDFPALARTRPVTDFTSNNNRPPQRRMRDKPWDEFGLVRAADAEDDDEEETAPVEDQTPAEAPPMPTQQPPQAPQAPQAPAGPSRVPTHNPITGPSFAQLNSTMRKDSTNQLLDAPQTQTNTSTPRMGAAKTVAVNFTDPQSFQTQRITIPTTSDTYIAELFDVACARLRLDKALYVFKVRGTQSVAPGDRTVEALGANLNLDLVRRRFGAVGDFGLGLSGSPGSSSPNAPLELVPNTPPTAKDVKKKKGFGVLHAGLKGEGVVSSTATSLLDLTGAGHLGRRYHVLRKQPLSFAASHPRTLVITPEYMQILPGEEQGGGYGAIPQGKVTNVPMSSIVGVKVSRKHPKMMRVLVYREKETKRYDFECASHGEAEAIVGDIRVGLAEYGVGGDDV